MYYINTFFIYSILGFLIESICFSFIPIESGILYGPWTIVYGFGMTFIYLIYDKWIYKYSKLKGGILLLFFASIFLGVFEYIGGLFLEKVFGIVYWNYDYQILNIGKYTSVKMSLIWGFSSTLVFLIIRNKLDNFIKKIPKYLTWIVLIIFFIDVFLTLWIKSKIISFFKVFF